MDKVVGFGLIGTGVGATFQAQAMSMIAGEGVARFLAVASFHEEKARSFASRWGIGSWYTDHHELLRREDIEAVTICTPHYLHAPMAIEAIEAGKHVLVDKPMAISLKEADEMVSAARRARAKLGVILQGRFDPTAQRLRKAVDDGRLGKLILGEAIVEWFRAKDYYANSPWRGRWATEGGGALINQAIHTIDLLQWYMGPVDYLWAQTDTAIHEIEVEDTAVAIIRFKNKALGVIQSTTSLYPGLPTRLEVHGSRGTVIIEGEALKRWSVIGEEEVVVEAPKKGLETWARPEMAPAVNHASVIRDFAMSIVEDREPYINGLEGRKPLEIILAIYHSSRTLKPISLPLTER